MEEAARHLDVDLTITELVESDFDRLLDRLPGVYDEPFGDFSAVPTMLVSEVAARDLRVVLSGDGGDELFGGYMRYSFAQALAVTEWVPTRMASGWSTHAAAAGSVLLDADEPRRGEPRWALVRGCGIASFPRCRRRAIGAERGGFGPSHPWPSG